MRYSIRVPRTTASQPALPDPPPKKRQKRSRRLPRVVWREDWEKFLAAAPSARDRAIIAIGLYSGLRVSEICSLDLVDVDVPGCLLHIRHGKGNKEAWQPLPRAAGVYVAAWLQEREQLFPGSAIPHSEFRIPHSDALFPSIRGRLCVRQVNRLIHEVGHLSGLGADLHPHALRHSCGTAMLEAGADLFEVKEYLRHEDIRSTQIYLHLRRTKLQAAGERL